MAVWSKDRTKIQRKSLERTEQRYRENLWKYSFKKNWPKGWPRTRYVSKHYKTLGRQVTASKKLKRKAVIDQTHFFQLAAQIHKILDLTKITLILTTGFSVLMTAWMYVLLGDMAALTAENHSFSSKYSACSNRNVLA